MDGAADDQSPPVIALLALGGTIAMVPAPEGAGAVPALTADELVRSVPALATIARVEAVAFRQLPGASIRFADLVALAMAIRERVDGGGVDGIVVTQGTDTLEESAFALDLLLRPPVPIVVTGAMRHPSSEGSDAAANLLAAVRVAADRRVVELGVVAVLNDEIHSARAVRKQHTTNPAAFASPLGGPLGLVSEDRVVLLTRPSTRSPTLNAHDGVEDPPVALVPLPLGEDGRLLRLLPELGYRGAVVEGTGGGHVPDQTAGELGELAAAMPVVLAARGRTGRVLTRTYGFPGSEMDLLRRGLLPAGTLDAVKARVLLSLLLREGASPARMREAFAVYS